MHADKARTKKRLLARLKVIKETLYMNTTSICSVEECANYRHRRSEWCHMHYERVRRHGDTNALFTFHNLCYSAEYGIWHSMRKRCHEPNSQAYKDYGGRGITVCEEWRYSFQAFYDYIGPRPSPEHSIERIDNDRGYEPGNVKWATRIEQANNRRSNRRIAWQGEVHTVSQWANLLNVRPGLLFHRLYAGTDIFKGLNNGKDKRDMQDA
ncbi:UNVERIFIED_ORG: hypothetical protein ABID57_000725 [Arthrobacter sp. UYEF1]